MASRLVAGILRSSLLFLLSVVLVAGFYFHSEFYAVGLYPLLLLGGFTTFLVVTAARLIVSGDLPRGRPRGELTFPFEEGDRLQRGAIELIVRPSDDAVPHVGQVVRARYETGAEFGRLVVLDATRKFLEEVTDEDARGSGHGSAAELREAVARRWRVAPDAIVAIIRVRPEASRR